MYPAISVHSHPISAPVEGLTVELIVFRNSWYDPQALKLVTRTATLTHISANVMNIDSLQNMEIILNIRYAMEKTNAEVNAFFAVVSASQSPSVSQVIEDEVSTGSKVHALEEPVEDNREKISNMPIKTSRVVVQVT
jgi:hypothetical protein